MTIGLSEIVNLMLIFQSHLLVHSMVRAPIHSAVSLVDSLWFDLPYLELNRVILEHDLTKKWLIFIESVHW